MDKEANFLTYVLCKNKLYKGNNFYKKFSELYIKYPKTILELLDRINEITYFNDYFNILYNSSNDELNMKIYKLIYTKLSHDIYNANNNIKISTLAKWMPRRINIKTDRGILKNKFIEEFSMMMYPEIKNKITRIRKYHKVIKRLTKIINPIELNLCAKKHDEINLNKISDFNVRKYSKVMKYTISEKYKTYMTEKYTNMKTNTLIKTLYDILDKNKNDKYKMEIELINDIWKKTFESLEFNDNGYLLIDIDAELYSNNKYNIISRMLIHLYQNNFYIMNGKNPKLLTRSDSLEKNINTFTENMKTSKDIDLNKIDKLLLDNNIKPNNYCVITRKNTNSNRIIKIEFNNRKNINRKRILIENIIKKHGEFTQYKSSYDIYMYFIILVLVLVYAYLYYKKFEYITI